MASVELYEPILSMRYYQPVWIRLKELPKDQASKVGVSITAPVTLHTRIIKAIGKEKWMDIGYKILLKETDDQEATLIYKREHAKLTFFLKFSVGIKDL